MISCFLVFLLEPISCSKKIIKGRYFSGSNLTENPAREKNDNKAEACHDQLGDHTLNRCFDINYYVSNLSDDEIPMVEDAHPVSRLQYDQSIYKKSIQTIDESGHLSTQQGLCSIKPFLTDLDLVQDKNKINHDSYQNERQEHSKGGADCVMTTMTEISNESILSSLSYNYDDFMEEYFLEEASIILREIYKDAKNFTQKFWYFSIEKNDDCLFISKIISEYFYGVIRERICPSHLSLLGIGPSFKIKHRVLLGFIIPKMIGKIYQYNINCSDLPRRVSIMDVDYFNCVFEGCSFRGKYRKRSKASNSIILNFPCEEVSVSFFVTKFFGFHLGQIVCFQYYRSNVFNLQFQINKRETHNGETDHIVQHPSIPSWTASFEYTENTPR